MPLKQILIVDDNQLLRVALCMLLKKELGASWFIQAASTGKEALEIITKKKEIKVVLLDIQMPGMNGLEVLETLRGRNFKGGIIMLSQFDSPSFVNHAIRQGANGFLIKDCSPQELFAAIKTVARGSFYDNALAQEWRKHAPQLESELKDLKLSPREQELFEHLKQGESSKQIAKFLKLSLLTVESYRKKLLKRTKTKNVAQLISFVTELGLFKRRS